MYTSIPITRSHPELSYVMQCAELCEDFHEDLEFHFSLGITSLLVSGTCHYVHLLQLENVLFRGAGEDGTTTHL